METSIPLDIIHTLRQLGISTTKALEFITPETAVSPADSSDLKDGTARAGEAE
ncbi:hypothetical protein J2T17_003739 [Paenibacillus mucilaginosus]|uniref:hypothetical protein n=1 Tax=Paenibacillus mucilaginosus TaxID=61624 RepID=UPI003D24E466